MTFVWDSRKAQASSARHGVWFADAEGVLFDPNALTREDLRAQSEQRFVSVGMDGLGRVLVVVHTHRGDDVRLISARYATRKERAANEEGI